MKKFISLILSLIISLSVVSCTSNEDEEISDFPIPTIEENEDLDSIEISHIDMGHLGPSYNALDGIGELNGFQIYDRFFQSRLVKNNLQVDLIMKSTLNYTVSLEFILTVTNDEEVNRNDLLYIIAVIFSESNLLKADNGYTEQMLDDTIELIGDPEGNLELVIQENSFAYVVEEGNLHVQINDNSFSGDTIFTLNNSLTDMGMEAGLHLISYSYQYRAQEQIMNITVQSSPSLELVYTVHMLRDNSINQAEASLNAISEFLPEKVSENITEIADAFRDLRMPWNSETDVNDEIIVSKTNRNQSDYFVFTWSEPLDFSYLN